MAQENAGHENSSSWQKRTVGQKKRSLIGKIWDMRRKIKLVPVWLVCLVERRPKMGGVDGAGLEGEERTKRLTVGLYKGNHIRLPTYQEVCEGNDV